MEFLSVGYIWVLQTLCNNLADCVEQTNGVINFASSLRGFFTRHGEIRTLHPSHAQYILLNIISKKVIMWILCPLNPL